jgi:DNA-binding transcriptional MocR family regulator
VPFWQTWPTAGFWIVDDDPYGDLRWRGAPGPPRISPIAITRFHVEGLAPGLRVGWVVAPVEVHRAMNILKQSADLHTVR